MTWTVLELRDTYEIGGPGKTILETFRQLDRGRYRTHLGVFLADGDDDRNPFTDAARAIDMPVHVIRGSHPYDPRLVSRLATLTRALGVDIVHAHEATSDVLAYLASRLRPVRTVTTVHGWIGNSVKQRVMGRLDRLVLRRFDRVIAVSQPIKARLEDAGVQAAALRLLHNGIVLERYRRSGRHGMLDRLVGTTLPRPVAVSIGRLSAEKGHADLLEALAIANKGGGGLTLVLIGDGPERPALEQRVSALGLDGSVFFTGYLSAPQAALEDADLLVLPSHTEGLPNVVLEALALEVPVLATSVGGTPEVVIDGETGRLVPSHSPAALAAALREFLEGPSGWQAMARRGHDMVNRQFDFCARTKSLDGIYTELMESPR